VRDEFVSVILRAMEAVDVTAEELVKTRFKVANGLRVPECAAGAGAGDKIAL